MTYHPPPPIASDSADEIATGLAMLRQVQRQRLDTIAAYRRSVIRWEVASMVLCAGLAAGALALAVTREGWMRWIMLTAAAMNVVTLGLCVASLCARLRALAIDARAARFMLAQVEGYVAEFEDARDAIAPPREAPPKTLRGVHPLR